MAADIFQVDFSQIRDFRRFLRKAPREFRVATAMLLNNFAFGTRKESIKTIHGRMQVRNQRFIESRLRVKKASHRAPTSSQVSEVGSIRSPRFTGWVEQQKGTGAKRTRIASLLARSSSEAKPIKKAFRMNRQYIGPDSIRGGKTDHHRAQIFMQKLSRNKYRKPFVLYGHRKIEAGLFKFRRKKLKRLQYFKPTKRQLQPQRLKWLTISRDRYTSRADIRGLWNGALRRIKRNARLRR